MSFGDNTGTRFVMNTRKWEVKNEVLMGILIVRDIKIVEFADMINVSSRAVQRWIYEGLEPNESNKKKVAEALGKPVNYLFGDHAYKK